MPHLETPRFQTGYFETGVTVASGLYVEGIMYYFSDQIREYHGSVEETFCLGIACKIQQLISLNLYWIPN